MALGRFLLRSLLALAGVALITLAPATSSASDSKSEIARKLGISLTFGRWPDGVVPYVYNPTGAPPIFSDNAYFLSLLQRAIAELEGAGGVSFSFQGIDENAVIANIQDSVVTVGWEDIGGAAGLAGPVNSCSGNDIIDIGYCQYVDGTVRLNNNGLAIDWDTGVTDFTERGFIQVATHELMHLLGIGHSEQQQSIMYADPYTNLHHLRPDDIDALRSLYGRPDVEDMASIYIPSAPGASPLEDSYISGSNDIGSEITSLDGSETDLFAGLLWRVPGGHTDDLMFVATDPHGYYYEGGLDDSDCGGGPGSSCFFWTSFASMETLFTFPGQWTVYVIMNGNVVATESVSVATSPTFNRAPDSYLVEGVIRGQAPLPVDLELVVTGDNEGDSVDATWHLPTIGEIDLDSGFFPGSAGTASASVNFDTPGEHEIYVEVNDDWTRYGSGGSAAGDGFRTLYRVVAEATNEADDITAFNDVSGDGIPDLAGFVGTYDGRPQIAVYSGANGDVFRTNNYINDLWRGIALATVRDGNQDGVANDPAVAMLVDNKTTDKIRVETRSLANNAFLGSIQFLNENWRAIDVVVVDDLNGDGDTSDTAIAVLSKRISDGRIQVQLRNFDDGSLISNVVYLNARWSAVAAAVADRSAIAPAGTLAPLIAVIAENPTNNRRAMQVRVAGSGTFDRNIKVLGSAWRYQDITVNPDANGDGIRNDPIWQVLATRDSDLVLRVQSWRVDNGAFESNRVILNSTWRGLRFETSEDIDGNSSSEMVFSALRRSNGIRRIHVKDYATSNTTLNIAP